MKESEAKLIESMADDYSNVLKEAKSMGCNEIKALYNIPLKNMEMIVQALEKQIPKKVVQKSYMVKGAVVCPMCEFVTLTGDNYCSHCGQKLDFKEV